MSESISTLCSELKALTGESSLSLPNSKVTAVDVSGFLKNVLKTADISISKAKVSCEGSSVDLSGSVTLFNTALAIKWGFTQESDDSITWSFQASTTSTSTVNNVIKHFMEDLPVVPTSLTNLQLKNLSLSTTINRTTGNYTLLLTAKTVWGDVQMYVQDDSGTWGAALGVSVSDSFHLSNLASELSVLNNLSFSKSALVISDFEDSSLSLSGITGVVKGVEFQSTLSIKKSSSKSAIPAIINELSSVLSGTSLAVTMDLSADSFVLDATIKNSFSLPGLSKFKMSGCGFKINANTTTPSVSLEGDVTFPNPIPASKTTSTLTVDGALSFTYGSGTVTLGATLDTAKGTRIVEPFHIPDVTLEEIGVGIDASFGAETGAGVTLEGQFQLGSVFNEKFAATAAITDGLPNLSLLSTDTTNLNLSDLASSLLGSGELSKALSGLKIKELFFVWCDQAQTLPDGTTVGTGFSFHGAIDLWGFDTYAALSLKSKDISGELYTSPISLFHNNISITGNGKGQHGVKAGGPYFTFNSGEDEFSASMDAKILGLDVADIDGTFSPSSLDFKLSTDLDFFKGDAAVVYKNSGETMALTVDLEVDINCDPDIEIGGVNFGKLHIDTGLSGGLSCYYNAGSLTTKVDGSFEFEGHSFSFDYELDLNITDLTKIGSYIESKLESEASDIFTDFLDDVEHYLELIGKGLLTDGEFVVNVLYHTFDVSIPDLFETLAKLPDKYHVNGTINFDLDIGFGVPSESLHADLGTIVDKHADILHGDTSIFGHHIDTGIDEHADLSASQSFSTPSFSVSLIDISPSEHFDFVIPPTVHADATSPSVGINPHLDVGIAGGHLGISGNVGVDSKVTLGLDPLSDLDLEAHINIDASAGVHADIAGLGVHGDTSHHIDESIGVDI
ncbi:MAG: hypothetical protein MI784_12355 [Cytophagales bacterium]|nr:hypothetical protein [Cytophagales bacterium]